MWSLWIPSSYILQVSYIYLLLLWNCDHTKKLTPKHLLLCNIKWYLVPTRQIAVSWSLLADIFKLSVSITIKKSWQEKISTYLVDLWFKSWGGRNFLPFVYTLFSHGHYFKVFGVASYVQLSLWYQVFNLICTQCGSRNLKLNFPKHELLLPSQLRINGHYLS